MRMAQKRSGDPSGFSASQAMLKMICYMATLREGLSKELPSGSYVPVFVVRILRYVNSR
jgi:hypothetical protein